MDGLAGSLGKLRVNSMEVLMCDFERPKIVAVCTPVRNEEGFRELGIPLVKAEMIGLILYLISMILWNSSLHYKLLFGFRFFLYCDQFFVTALLRLRVKCSIKSTSETKRNGEIDHETKQQK
jgi:hypothetical protein